MSSTLPTGIATIWDARDAIASQDANGNRWTSVFDALDRPIASVSPLGFYGTTVYDGAGQTIASVDALSFRTSLN